tara:strand:+ start:426 stop:2171 length:1746 start_codon:yes stop_codon:yes gene_type:complete
MWSKEKTIEWKELGSRGKYKKRFVNKKNSCFEKNINTYKRSSDNYRVEGLKNETINHNNIGDKLMSTEKTHPAGWEPINETLSELNKSEMMYLASIQYYWNQFKSERLNPNPIYQRPYHYNDDSTKHFGKAWQKQLISDFLSGKFIQPIHLRLLDNNTWEIIDGGHRTRTLISFLENKLKTPAGLELDFNGKSYDIGDMKWSSITSTHSDIENLLDKLKLLIVECSDLTHTQAKEKFLKLNDLHNMTDAEKRNADDTHLASLCRTLGAIDFSPYTIFNEYDDKGGLTNIGLKSIKRQTDELVSTIVMWLHCGITNYSDGGSAKLNELYLNSNKSKEKDEVFKKGGDLYQKTFELLEQINNMVLESDWTKSKWKKLTLQKMTILLDWFYKSVDYNIDDYKINWKTFVNAVDTINSDDKIEPHTPHTRYSLYNGKKVIKEKPKNDGGERYQMKAVFGSGNRIDDIEYWLYNIVEKFDMKSFGITQLKDSKRTFNDKQKRQAWVNADFKCQECNKKVTMAEARADHILPHSKGGKTDSTNLQILCEDCNESKSSSMSTNDLQKVLNNKNNLSPEQIKQIAEILA